MKKTQKTDFLIYKNASGKLESFPVIIETTEDGKGITGNLCIYNPTSNELLGTVNYTLEENNKKKSLSFEGLVSHTEIKGIGTKLILELINISKNFGADGVLTAKASPYRLLESDQKTAKPLTNIPFYYKLGFQATNPDRHNAIKMLLEEKKDIPLGLNAFTYIELSKEAAIKLEQKAIAKQREFEKQNITNTSQVKQFNKAIDNVQEKLKATQIKNNYLENIDSNEL